MRRWLMVWMMGAPLACASAPAVRKTPSSPAPSPSEAKPAPALDAPRAERRDGLVEIADAELRLADHTYALRIAQAPGDPRGYVARAMVRQRAGDLEGAARLYRDAVGVDRTFGPAYANHGAMLLENGDFNAARELLMRGAAESPDHAPIFANLAAALSESGRHEEAIASAETAIEIDDKDADLRRNHAAVLYKAKHYADAERTLKRALAEFPDEAPDFLLRLSELHIATGEDERALEELERVSKLVPEFPMPYLRRAALLGRRDDLDGALRVLAEGLEHNPHDEDLREFFSAALAMRMHRDMEEGQARIKHDSKDVGGYILVARVHQMGRDYDAAYAVLHHGVTENPESGALWSQMGTVELFRDHEREALAAWRKAIALDRGQGTALNNCAFLLVTARDEELRNKTEALELARRALALEPKNPNFLDTLAEVYFAHGDVGAARNTIGQALTLSPGDDRLQAQARRFDDALAERQKEVR